MTQTSIAFALAATLALGAGTALAQSSYPAVPPPNTPAPYPGAGAPYPAPNSPYSTAPAPQGQAAPGAPNAGYAGPGPSADVPPALPPLTAEQESRLEQEFTRYRREVDDRVARGEIGEQEAAKLLSWRRWQIARQVAGLAPPEPPRVVYAPPPRYYAYDPYWYGRPYAPGYYYYGPRISVCAGGFGHHSFGSVCF